MLKKGEVIINNGKVTNVLNNFFSNIVDLLEIPEKFAITNMSYHIEDNVEKAIVKYNKHPSILKIKEKRTNVNTFSLWHTKIDVITEIILSMEVNKASPKDDIPLNIIKSNYAIFAPLLCNDFKLGIDNNKFPDALISTDIKPSIKLDDRQNKVHYRPVSLLPVLSKVYEKVLYGQTN